MAKTDFLTADLTHGQTNALVKNLMQQLKLTDPIEAVRMFNAGEVIVVKQSKPDEPQLDFSIHINRSVKPLYPDWMKKVIHPELELTGPAEYNLQNLDLWLHDDQKTGTIEGNKIYKKLKGEDVLADCLNLADLLAIQAKGIDVFRKLFAGKAIFAWKSVVQDRCGSLAVPYLVGSVGKVVVDWDWLGNSWGSRDPALRFRK